MTQQLKILFSPQFNEYKKLKYFYNGEALKVEEYIIKGKNHPSGDIPPTYIYYYDLANVDEGQKYKSNDFIQKIEIIDGILQLYLLNFIGHNSTAEENYPKWQELKVTEFELPEDINPIELEPIITKPIETPLTEVEDLKKKNLELETNIDLLKRQIANDRINNEAMVNQLLDIMMSMM